MVAGTSELSAVRPSPLVRPRPKTNKWLVTVSITFGTLMGAIDSSIVSVALPHMMGTLGATVQEITWISTGYIIANVVVMPFTAFLGRQFGQKRVYMFCLALFLLGSILCGTARTLPALIAFRAVQGFGAGALQPTEQAILRQTFPVKEQGMAMALFGMAVMLGPALGPTLGGWIVDNYAWPWIFYINVPIGILGLSMVTAFVHEDEDIVARNRDLAQAQRKNIDWWGIGLLVAGLCSLQYFLEEGQQDDWFESTTITVAFWAALVLVGAFVIRELTCEVPAVNVRLFKDRVFLSGTLIGSLNFALLMGTMFLLPLFMQTLLGFSATDAGFAMMPRVLVMLVATPIVGRIYNVVSPRIMIGAGILFIALGAWDMSHFTLQSGQDNIVFAIMMQGAGFSCLFVPLSTTALAAIPRHKMADATGLNSLFRQVGGSIGLAVGATLLTRYGDTARSALVAHVSASSQATLDRVQGLTRVFQGRGMDAVRAHDMALRSLDGIVEQQATLLAFNRVFLLAGIAFLFLLPVLYFLKVPDQPEAGPKQKIEVHLE
jgi:DHA2 family multidrug resistance protein